ncbi:MAG TPA: universal stress protein [Polyangiaceae bacterium]
MAEDKRAYVILLAYDYTDIGKAALAEAFNIANTRVPSELHVIHVAGPLGDFGLVELPSALLHLSVDQALEHLRDAVDAELRAFASVTPVIHFERVVTHQRVGDAAREIAQLAADLGTDLVVAGTHGRKGVQRLVIGSVAERTVRLCPCPVLVVRPKESSNLPELDPVCPDCARERQRTAGQELWCEGHRRRHGARHTYHYVDRNTLSCENMPLVTRGRAE